MRVSFVGGLQGGNHTIVNVISTDNLKQTGVKFAVFIKAVNKLKNKISKLYIVDTTYLNRHYDMERFGKHTVSAWQIANRKYLDLCQVPVRLISWCDLIETDECTECYRQVISLYKEKSSEYREIVQRIAKPHAEKASYEKAINYLLEEGAGYLTLKGTIVYPGGLNESLQYLDKVYSSENRQYIRYRIRGRSSAEAIISRELFEMQHLDPSAVAINESFETSEERTIA